MKWNNITEYFPMLLKLSVKLVYMYFDFAGLKKKRKFREIDLLFH